jgi:hypothetical protein
VNRIAELRGCRRRPSRALAGAQSGSATDDTLAQ